MCYINVSCRYKYLTTLSNHFEKLVIVVSSVPNYLQLHAQCTVLVLFI